MLDRRNQTKLKAKIHILSWLIFSIIIYFNGYYFLSSYSLLVNISSRLPAAELHSYLHRFGSRTGEPSSGNRSASLRSLSQWVSCPPIGVCWGACTCSHPGWPVSTTPSTCHIYHTCLPCCPPGHTPVTQVLSASAPAPAWPPSRPHSVNMRSGTAH